MFFFSEHVYKNYLNVIIELWSNPGLHLHLVIADAFIQSDLQLGST